MGTFNIKDYYSDKAKAQGYKARSIFKLEEIDKNLKLVKPHSVVLDLGCAPGSWLQYVGQKISSKGFALGVDLTEVGPLGFSNVKTVVFDCFKLSPEIVSQWMMDLKADWHGFDLLLSDMAPKTTGIKHVDQIRSFNLAEQAFLLSETLLKQNGNLVIKIFGSGEVSALIAQMKKKFSSVKQVRPKSVRSVSKEFYVVGLNKK